MASTTNLEHRYPVPSKASFVELEFAEAPDLQPVLNKVIEEHADRLPARDAHIDVLWKAAGGKSKGNPTLGKCVKPSGLLAYYAGSTFIVWLAADHARDFGLTGRQIEALLFRELSHIDKDEDDQWILVGYDFEGFQAELAEYGAWNGGLQRAQDGLQSSLWPDGRPS